MVIHLYAQCWNDEWMLPFFFRHYDPIVDRYFIYDDGSTDNTVSLLEDHPKVEPHQFFRAVPDSFVASERVFSNHVWKQSREQADWVIVTDVDEHLLHPSGRDYLAASSAAGKTIIPALGFQMISRSLPAPDDNLSTFCRRGAPRRLMMKASIFDPKKIVEIAFTPGRHRAEPIGRIRFPDRDEISLLHFKYIGYESARKRQLMLGSGLGPVDLGNRWGLEYSWSDEKFRADWEQVEEDAVDVPVAMSDPDWAFPVKRWWDKYRD